MINSARVYLEALIRNKEKLGIMEKELNELVVRLMKEQEVECARPEKTAEALK